MSIVHIKVVFRDAFSGATNTKIVTRSTEVFEKMKKAIGSTVDQFDKTAGIHWIWVVESVEQATYTDIINPIY